MGCVSNLKAALQLLVAEVPNVDKISLVLGPSPLRPLHIFELNFSNGRPFLEGFSRSKTAETLSRKVVAVSFGLKFYFCHTILFICFFF